jgi:hypothetical protein
VPKLAAAFISSVRLCGFAVIRKAEEVFCANNESQEK